MVHVIQWVRRDHCFVIIYENCKQSYLEEKHANKASLGCSSGREPACNDV